MIKASRSLSVVPSRPAIPHRMPPRRGMRSLWVPQGVYDPAPQMLEVGRRSDLSFFVGCYAAGLVFLFIMLS